MFETSASGELCVARGRRIITDGETNIVYTRAAGSNLQMVRPSLMSCSGEAVNNSRVKRAAKFWTCVFF